MMLNTNDSSRMNGPLQFSYPCFIDMLSNNLVFMYRGVVTSDLVTYVLQIMEEKLEEDKVSKKTSKKVFNVMIECLRNVYSDGINQELSEIESTAILLVKSEDDGYLVSTGNYIKNTEVELLKNRLDKINQMDGEKLKVYYQELLASPVTEKGITSLGMIDIARKSKQKIAYQFQTVNEFFTFFTLEAKVVRK